MLRPVKLSESPFSFNENDPITGYQTSVEPKTSANFSKTNFLARSKSCVEPSSFSSEVTPLSEKPHGLMCLKYSKSVLIFKANPCMVTKRELFTPIAQIFLAEGLPTSIQTPVA